MSFKCVGGTLAVALAAVSALAQTIIPVGAGSYASYPPPQANAGSLPTTPPTYLVTTNGGPIPSNKWWTDLILDQYAGNMWAQPLTVSANAQGVSVYNPTNWVPSGLTPQLALDGLITIQGQQFAPADSRALRWGDWTVSLRMQQTANQFMDVTLGHGLPSVWVEFTGVQPQIGFPNGGNTFFDDNGNSVSFPLTGSHLGVAYSGRYWGVFAPSNTQFTLSNGVINVAFAGTNTFLVLSALPAEANLSYFAQYAYAVPRDSQMSWTYDPVAGAVTTAWHLTTQILQGSQPQVIQGWLAHHWRNTSNNLAFNGINYSTARGPMKCATGTDFQIVYPFNGFPPTLPPPAPTGLPNDYDPARMGLYLTNVAADTNIAVDTYWGGKDLMRYAQHMAMAHDMGSPEFAILQNTVRSGIENWFTYTPGESTYYFAAYPAWKGIVGFESSYGSEQFNDQHFHYGYFTYSTALVGMYDPAFVTNYGPMATLVAKEYANWDRSDTNFPFFRTFDIWAGHSQASGFPDVTRGGNQESSGEAMNSWSGLFLLGSVLGNSQMQGAGAMGYVMESAAVREYWFNQYGGVWPAVYTPSAVGILWDNGQDYQTYFGMNPIYIHGIQWLPISPGSTYLAQDPVFCQQQYNSMLSEQLASEGDNSISSMGSQWGNYALWYALQFNPDYVAAQMDQLYASDDPVATDPIYAGSTYYFTHAYRTLGSLQWQFHLSVPTSGVYYNTNTAQYSYVAYNPLNTAQVATVYSNNIALGSLLLPAYTLVNTHVLNSTNAIPLIVVSTSPSASQTNVSTALTQVAVTFSQNVSAASLAGAAITGSNVTGLTYAQGDGTPTIDFNIIGQLQYSQTYSVTIPASAAVSGGTNTLGSPFTFSFTTAPNSNAIPLVVESTSPSANQTGVASDLTQVSVTFNRGVAAASLSGAAMAGSGVTGLTYAQGDGTPTIAFNINGQLQLGQTYTVTIPASAAAAGGTNILGTNYLFSFTTSATQTTSQNLVLNPGFELAGTNAGGATNWTVTQAAGGPVYAVRTNDNVHGGSWNFEVHLASVGAGPVVQFAQAGVPVTGGSVYSFCFYADQLSGSSGAVNQWNIQWYGANGLVGSTGFQTYTAGNNAYTLVSNQVTAAAGAATATVIFYSAGAASSSMWATIDLDDVSLGSTNAVTGGGGPQTNVVSAQVLAGVGISWPTVAHTNYTVQCATNLGGNTVWSTLAGPIVGDGTTNLLFQPFGTAPRSFYRIQQGP
jgi:endoglucanase Acf2